MQKYEDRISIQVGLSGYSFKVRSGEDQRTSGWMTSERVFTTPEFQKTYDDVEVSVFTPKVTLVPEQFYDPDRKTAMLGEVSRLGASDVVDAVAVPEFAAVLLYSNTIGETLSTVISQTVLRRDGSKTGPLPEIYYMLRTVLALPDYNKIMASYMDGTLYLVITQGRSLLLCNSYQAADFTTAEYFIFLAMKKLQLNPEISTICFRTPLSEEEELSLYRYFKSVEQI